MSSFTPTKKVTSDLVKTFINEKNSIFSDVKRNTAAVEDKVVDVIHMQVMKAQPKTFQEMKAVVDELMRDSIQLADKLNFVKIIYDFILISANEY